jgi:hypothetical protein
MNRIAIRGVMICILSLFILSCDATHRIMSDKTKSKKLINQLLERNGNSFYISSTHVTVSFVWSYSGNTVTIYKLSKGKIVETKELAINSNIKGIENLSEQKIQELDACMELDGDIFGFRLKKDGKVIEQDLPVNLECFTRNRYKSDFLNKIVADINNYQIKW